MSKSALVLLGVLAASVASVESSSLLGRRVDEAPRQGAAAAPVPIAGAAARPEAPTPPPVAPPEAPDEEDPTACADSELAAALAHKYGGAVKAEDLDYVYYFTTYSIPQRWKVKGVEVPLRREAEWALSFVVNSCASFRAEGYVEKPKRVPGSKTLWYVNVRDYGWVREDLDAVFAIQPYFLAPLTSGKENAVIFRADWFIANAMDVTKQDDRGIKDVVYYILQYGKGNEPKNADDFRKAWLVDVKTIREQRLETGTIVDAGESGVSQHTRQLRRGRTVAGYYWESRDVKTHDLDLDKVKSRDFIEDLFANQFDAGEYIASKKSGLQTYLLTAGVNDKFKEVKFGDPTVVIDRQDTHDPRVRTGKGCVVCHSMGIIPYTNAVRDLFRSGVDLRSKSYDLYRELKAFYLRNDGSEVEDDNRLFERAVKQCNGLEPAENAKVFLHVYEWYVYEKVTLQQAAYEWGVSVADYKKAIRPTTTGRLSQLYYGRPMPREVWDSVNAGGYVQSGFLIKVGAKPPEAPPAPEAAKEKEKESPGPAPPEAPPSQVEVATENASLLDAEGNLLVYLGSGIRASVVRAGPERYLVRYDRWEGYLLKSEVKPVR